MKEDLFKKPSIIRYREEMKNVLSMYYPELTDSDIYTAIDYSINKRYKRENAILDNNYKKKKAAISLTDITDYIMDKKPIVTGWGVLFSRKGTVPNPLIKMIKNFMELRNIHKKQMFQYPKGSEDFEKYNLLQLLDKIDANGTYGVLGMYCAMFYNIHVAATITTQGRSLISAATLCFEQFLANNAKFGSLDQVIQFIANVCGEKNERKFNDRIILDKNVSVEDCFIKLVMNCGFEWMPTEEDLDIIWNMVNKLTQEDINRIYYKNNLYEFMGNSSMQNSIDILLSKLNSPFMDPNEPPEEIKDELDLFTEIMMEYVYYHHMIIDGIDRCDNMKKSVCAISDTDSAIVSFDAWYRYNLDIIIKNKRKYKFMETRLNFIEYIENNKRASFIEPIEKDLDYDFFNEKTIEIERQVNFINMIPQDNMRYTLINIIAYVAGKVVNDNMERFTKLANSYIGPGECLIYMKNEFLFKRALLTNAKKNYATIQELQEGNRVPEDEQLDLKGLAIDKSTMNKSTRKELKQILYEDILKVDYIDQVAVIKKLAIMEDKIYKSLKSGSKDYYKPLTVKPYSSYKDPLKLQGIKATIAWNGLKGDLEGFDMDERNAVDVVKVDINATTAEKIKESHPDVYGRIIEIVGTIDTPSSNTLYKEAFKGNINTIAIPKDIEVPDWVLEFINYSAIINDNLCNFPKESIGLRNLGKDTVNYSNIIKL